MRTKREPWWLFGNYSQANHAKTVTLGFDIWFDRLPRFRFARWAQAHWSKLVWTSTRICSLSRLAMPSTAAWLLARARVNAISESIKPCNRQQHHIKKRCNNNAYSEYKLCARFRDERRKPIFLLCARTRQLDSLVVRTHPRKEKNKVDKQIESPIVKPFRTLD
jgi:hypothetical protein